MSRPSHAAALLAGLAVVAVPLIVEPMPSAPVRELVAGQAAGEPAGEPATDPGAVDGVLARASAARASLPREGELVVVGFSETGPSISRMEVAFGDGGVRIRREGGTEVGRVDGQGSLRSSPTLLQVGGVEQVPVSSERLHAKYDAALGAPLPLDTGLAVAVSLSERETGTLRETLYADQVTGPIVRRETYGRDGAPVRTVAFTRLEVAERPPSVPRARGRDVQAHEVTTADPELLREDGFVIPASLPRGYELTTVLEVPDAVVPTLHLIYVDGLYSLSVFRQQGRMRSTATVGASELRTPTGGAVWRWPGSEPRRIVWSGDGATFTALADTPTDELLDAIVGLPTDPPPSILGRLDRGSSRVARWVSPKDRSTT